MTNNNLLIAVVAGVVLWAGSAVGDRIVLRDLSRMSDVTVARFDEDGVVLEDGRRLDWDRIERATLESGRQADFDRWLRDVGEPLFRIRKRLAAGDYRELVEEAEALYPRYRSRQSPTAYVVCQAVMWARLANGRREAAVEPYLRCVTCLRSLPKQQVDLTGNRGLRMGS
jgi:hypothetical protein